MGKHKNAFQNATMLSCMQKYPEMATGHSREKGEGDHRAKIEHQWKRLAETLNSQGPPTKDTSSWKKTWTDWKSEVKKKLVHNKSFPNATAGGPFAKKTLSEAEEAVARISGMYGAVEAIPGTSSFGIFEEVSMSFSHSSAGDEDWEMPASRDQNDDDVKSISSEGIKRSNSMPLPLPSSPKRIKTEPPLQESLKNFMDAGYTLHQNFLKKVNEMEEAENENKSSLHRVHRSIEKVNDTIDGLRQDLKQHHLKMEKLKLEEIKLKHRELELSELHLKAMEANNK